MKLKKLSIALITSALLFTGCNKSSGGGKNPPSPGPDPHPVSSFDEAITDILTYHNYTMNMKNMWEGERTPWAEFNVYNLNNDAIYNDYEGYYSGYIKQKDQGIVSFNAPKTGTGLIVGSFRATNLDRNVIDIEPTAPEHFIDAAYSFDETKGEYVCSDFNAIAVIANLAFGEWVQLAIAPENFTGKFANNKLVFTAIFEVIYYDEDVEYDLDATVTLTFKDFGSTYNKSLLDYIANPSVVYVAPTAWDNGIKDYFDTYYNKYYPPFIDGLSYSWKYGRSQSEGSYTVAVEDYYSGNLIPGYIEKLVEEGFHEVTNPGYIEYVKTVEDGQKVHKYSAKMKYFAPTDTDSSGMPYSYLYPNGVSFFNFLHKDSPIQTITTVKALNEYMAGSIAGSFLPAFDLADDTKVTQFKDGTSGQESFALLLKGTTNEFFNIYPDTKEHAINCFNKIKTYLEAKGFDYQVAFGSQYWFEDDYGTIYRITDPNSISTWTSSYIQVRIGVTQGTIDAHAGEDVVIESLSLSGQKTTFTVGESFSFDGTATVIYSDNHTKDVSNSVTVTTAPNMEQEGEQTVTISYTEDGDTVSASYTITVNPAGTTYNINTSAQTGATITITQPESGNTAVAGDIVKFKVDVTNDYYLGTISVTCGGSQVSYMGPHIQTREYQFTMPSGNVTISVTTSPVVVTHNISYVIKDAESGSVLSYSDVIASNSNLPTSFVENSTIVFSVVTTSEYSFASASIESSTFTNSAFTYNGLNSDLQVTIFVNTGGSEDVLYGSYSVDRPNAFSNPNYYDRYTIILNEDGTGSYIRENHNADPRTYTLFFTYTVIGNKITFTYGSGTNTDFYNGFRLFDSDSTETRSVNNTGVINGDGTISVTLVKSGVLDQTYTFSK